MPTDQAEAIVLRTMNVGDQDKIAVFFCRDKGVIRGVAKGARKFGNRFGSASSPCPSSACSTTRRSAAISSRSPAATSSSRSSRSRPSLHTAFLLTYFAELVEEFAPTRAREDVLYRLLLSVLRCLKEGGDREFAAAYFEAWFLQANGFSPTSPAAGSAASPSPRAGSPPRGTARTARIAPRSRRTRSRPPSGIFLRWVRKNPPPGGCAPPFPADEIAAIRKTLQALIVYHMDREPRTLHFLKTK